jgi:autotransporter-associated beta strand protein
VPLALYSKPPGTDGKETEIANPAPLNSAGQTRTPVYFEENGAFIIVRDRRGVKMKEFTHISDENSRDVNAKGDVKAGRNVEAGVLLISHGSLHVEEMAQIKEKLTAGSLTVSSDAYIGGTLLADNIRGKTDTKVTKITAKDIAVDNITGAVSTKGISNAGNITNTGKTTTGSLEVTNASSFKGDVSIASGKNLDVGGNITAGAFKRTDGAPLAFLSTDTASNQEPPAGSYLLAMLQTGQSATLNSAGSVNFQNGMPEFSLNSNGGNWRVSGVIVISPGQISVLVRRME